jgi:Helix-turn-helix domain
MFVSSASAPRAQDGIDTKSNSAPQQQIGRYDWLRQMGKDRALKAFHRVVLLHLALCRNDKTGRCDPGNKWLAEQAGCCERWVVEAIKLAEERGWLRRERARGGRSNNYVLTMSDVHSSSHQTDEAEPDVVNPSSKLM